MHKKFGIGAVSSIVIALGLIVYFVYQPLLGNINLGLDLRGGASSSSGSPRKRRAGNNPRYN